MNNRFQFEQDKAYTNPQTIYVVDTLLDPEDGQVIAELTKWSGKTWTFDPNAWANDHTAVELRAIADKLDELNKL